MGEPQVQRAADPVVVRIADHGAHVVLLVDQGEHGPPGIDVVERRMEVVHPQEADIAELVQHLGPDGGIALQDVDQIERRRLEEVDLAGLECCERGLGIGHDVPFDPLDVHDLAAGHAARRLVARHVVGVALVDHLAAGHPLVGDEAERARADRGGDLLVGIGRGVVLAHHVAERGAGLGEHVEHQAVGLVQPDLERIVAGRGDLLDPLHHVLAAAVARRPAVQ
jgi:hypothetical protein